MRTPWMNVSAFEACAHNGIMRTVQHTDTYAQYMSMYGVEVLKDSRTFDTDSFDFHHVCVHNPACFDDSSMLV